ncbi:MAG: radical SAM protein [Pseudomonadota bacterium]
MPNILLFNPPGPAGKGYTREGRCTQEAGVWGTVWPPVTLATAAALLREQGHAVTVLDCSATGMSMAGLETVVRRLKPDLAVWNTGTPTLAWDLRLGAHVKTWSNKTVTGVMGTHVTAQPEPALAAPGIDAVIRREPEAVIAAMARGLPDDWRTVAGISYLNSATGAPVHNPDADFLPPESIPAPAWDTLDLSPYRLPLKGRHFVIVAPIRGCPFSCTFCTAPVYYGKRLRKRPVAAVVDEMVQNVRRFAIRDFFIWADTFTADRGYVAEFCHAVRHRLPGPVAWTCNSRVDTVDAELLALMKSAGMWMISFGIESANDRILSACGKRISRAQSEAAVRAAAALGIKVSGHFIFGLPGESRASMRETLAFALSLPLDIAQFYTAAAFPGTRLYSDAQAAGWFSPDTGQDQHRSMMHLPGLSAATIDRFRESAFRRFYARPSALWRLARMVEPPAIRNVITNLKGFFTWAKQ